jgi:hypothetical protein
VEIAAMELPDRVLKALGSITVNFEALDHRLQFFSWGLLVGHDIQNQKFGRAATAGLSFARRLDLFQALLRLRYPDDPRLTKDGEMSCLCGKMATLEQKRNTYVHSAWIKWGDESAMRRKTTTRKGELVSKFEEVSADTLETFAEEIRQTEHALLSACLNLLGVAPVDASNRAVNAP